MYNYLDFSHDAAATAAQNGFCTHFCGTAATAAAAATAAQCEYSHWIQCNPFIAAKIAATSEPCEQTINLLRVYSAMLNIFFSSMVANKYT